MCLAKEFLPFLRPPFSILSTTPLSPSIHKFDNELIHSGLSAALGHEQIGLEPLGLEPFGLELMAERLMAERLTAERLGPNGVSRISKKLTKIRYRICESKHLA